MKGSKVKIAHWLMIGFLLALGIIAGIDFTSKFLPDSRFGCDLRLRRNEILCAHQGIDSFRIWNRDVTLTGFTPIWRPDRPKLEKKDGDRPVHAYPAWHTFFFYFYGWLPELMCIALMSLCYGVCVKFIVDEILTASKEITPFGGIAAGYVLALIAFPSTQCFFVLNYGIFLTAVFLLLRKFSNSGHQIWAGLCWALMMIKPQVGLLFFWPLLWHKKYKTIVTAIIVCVFASCATAFLVNENPINMILQIPEIGKPYGLYFIGEKVLKPILGDSASMIWMSFFFCLSALLSYGTRGIRDLLVSSSPIVAFIPIWTYSQPHDHVILIGWYLATVVCALEMKWWKRYWQVLIFVTIFTRSWVLACFFGVFDPAGKGWMYYLMSVGFDMLTVYATAVFSWQAFKHKLPKELSGECCA